MLRTSLRSVKALGSAPVIAAATRQWRPAVTLVGRRHYDSKVRGRAPQNLTEAEIPVQTTLPPGSVASRPDINANAHAPVAGAPPIAPTGGPIPPGPDPPRRRGFFHRLKVLFYTTVFLGGVLYGFGVYYAQISDPFYDAFVKYVPGAEKVLMWLEEYQFQRSLPASEVGAYRLSDYGQNVKVSPRSGASWRVADTPGAAASDSGTERLVVPKNQQAPEARKSAVRKSGAREIKEMTDVREARERKEAQSIAEAQSAAAAKQARKESEEAKNVRDAKKVVQAEQAKHEATRETGQGGARAVAVPVGSSAAVMPFKAPEVDEPSRMPPTKPIDPMTVKHATEPAVQELVRMANDLITLISADNADGRYSGALEKLKAHVNSVGDQIMDIKSEAAKEAQSQFTEYIDKFDAKAKQMASATEKAISMQEKRHKAETSKEIAEIRSKYEAQLKETSEKEKKHFEQRTLNLMKYQALHLVREFQNEVADMVEKERNGRLGKLKELEAKVAELEKLSSTCDEVVNTCLKAQKLHIAVQAVQAALEESAQPRPFVKQLVALKEVAADNPVIDAAIASINPAAYQQGIASPSVLIDRFRRVADEVRKASLLPDGAGVASHASSWMLSHLMFKKHGVAEGDDIESTLTRTQTFLEQGNLDAAAREMNSLGGWAKTLSKDWLDEVRRVLEVQQALDVISTEARLQTLMLDRA